MLRRTLEPRFMRPIRQGRDYADWTPAERRSLIVTGGVIFVADTIEKAWRRLRHGC